MSDDVISLVGKFCHAVARPYQWVIELIKTIFLCPEMRCIKHGCSKLHPLEFRKNAYCLEYELPFYLWIGKCKTKAYCQPILVFNDVYAPFVYLCQVPFVNICEFLIGYWKK